MDSRKERESADTNYPNQDSPNRPSSSTSVSSIGGATGQISTTPCYYNNSLAIRQEIQRFESVHPSIYAIYDLLELIGDADGQLIAQRVREHVVCIEDSFVNSQEWTLSRSVPDLRLGIVGTVSSGKSALVHRYLTESYLQDESPEGGRFKKEVIINGQSYLLLIRDEGGPPEMQLSCWVDAVIFVFSLDDETSFNVIYNYYARMFHLRSNHNIPILLVGTQDAISETNPRVIDESRARRLSQDLKRCAYYETNATNGLNVEKVFQNACYKIIQARNAENIGVNNHDSRPNTPGQNSFAAKSFHSSIHSTASPPPTPTPLSNISNGGSKHGNLFQLSPTHIVENNHCETANKFNYPPNNNNNNNPEPSKTNTSVLESLVMKKPAISEKPKYYNNNHNNNNNNNNNNMDHPIISKMATTITCTKPTAQTEPLVMAKRNISHKFSNEFKIPLDNSTVEIAAVKPAESCVAQTPNTSRKNRRKSNLFTPLSSKNKNDDKYKNGEVGSGRTIPIKQGYLYKKSKKTLNKDWKKKYVTLTTDGCLTYHPTLHDYMDDVHGKNISLKHTTVKVPGQKPRCGRAMVIDNARRIPSTNPKYDPSSGKKRSRKIKNTGTKSGDNGDDSDGNEFVIVSLDNKQWHFNANNTEEREEWITAIEQQILSSLQNSESYKSQIHNVNSVDDSTIHSIKTVPGNKYCVDCEAPNPDWASLNLGALICIECSGIHRNLGTHISKVRSLGLDVWPPSHVSVMLGLGNTAVNQIWEHSLNGKTKPTPTSKQEEKEKFIRSKYVHKEFLAPIDHHAGTASIQQLLIESVMKMDIKRLVHLLAHASMKNINLSQIQTRDKKTLLHLAASRGCLEIIQLLIWNNVNEKALDNEGKTAMFYARIAGHEEIEELLNQSCGGGSDQKQPHKQSQESGINIMNPMKQSANRNENIPLSFKNIDLFNKLPASII